jgi:hypothetical protein
MRRREVLEAELRMCEAELQAELIDMLADTMLIIDKAAARAANTARNAIPMHGNVPSRVFDLVLKIVSACKNYVFDRNMSEPTHTVSTDRTSKERIWTIWRTDGKKFEVRATATKVTVVNYTNTIPQSVFRIANNSGIAEETNRKTQWPEAEGKKPEAQRDPAKLIVDSVTYAITPPLYKRSPPDA